MTDDAARVAEAVRQSPGAGDLDAMDAVNVASDLGHARLLLAPDDDE